MITQERQKQGAALMNSLVQKAWESATFKEQLTKNPVSVIESITGEKMKEDTKIVVEDQTDGSVVYLNIPREPNLEELELTEEQLEMVAGGLTPTFIALGYGIMAGVAIYAAANV